MEMKLRMALYTFVAIFIKIVFNLLQGENTIEITELLSMWGIIVLHFQLTCLIPLGARRGARQ